MTPIGPMVSYFLAALTVPVLWATGAIGAVVLARRKRRWMAWAIAFFVAAIVVFPVITALVNQSR